MEDKNCITLFIVSDSVGETAQKAISAVMAQYPELKKIDVKRFPFINNKEDLIKVLSDALRDRAIVAATLVSQELIEVLKEFAERTGLDYVDYMTPLSKLIQGRTGLAPQEEPGALHKLNQEYFNKVEAIEFAIKYDDGKDPRGFLESDYVILGISRTSKTPLSMYLANKSYKVANLPLIPEVPLPKEVYEVKPGKIIGLTADPEYILRIRQSRLDSLGLKQSSEYASIERIKEELSYSEQIFADLHAKIITVDDKAVEEMATMIEEHN